MKIYCATIRRPLERRTFRITNLTKKSKTIIVSSLLDLATDAGDLFFTFWYQGFQKQQRLLEKRMAKGVPMRRANNSKKKSQKSTPSRYASFWWRFITEYCSSSPHIVVVYGARLGRHDEGKEGHADEHAVAHL